MYFIPYRLSFRLENSTGKRTWWTCIHQVTVVWSLPYPGLTVEPPFRWLSINHRVST